MPTVLKGKIISEADARRLVAYARAQRWLAPKALCYVCRRNGLIPHLVETTCRCVAGW